MWDEIEEHPDFLRGAADARSHIAAGRLCLRSSGTPPAWILIYRDLLEKELSIETVTSAGCMVTETQMAFDLGYNQVMNGEIDQRYGQGALDKLARKAEQLFEKHGFDYMG